jgi:hypothetical protein
VQSASPRVYCHPVNQFNRFLLPPEPVRPLERVVRVAESSATRIAQIVEKDAAGTRIIPGNLWNVG